MTHIHEHDPIHIAAKLSKPPKIEHIEVTVARFLRGKGCCNEDPIREVVAFYLHDGTLLVEEDPHPIERPPT